MWKEDINNTKTGPSPLTFKTPPTPSRPESATPLSKGNISPQAESVKDTKSAKKLLSSKGQVGKYARALYNTAKKEAKATGMSEKEAQAAGLEAVANRANEAPIVLTGEKSGVVGHLSQSVADALPGKHVGPIHVSEATLNSIEQKHGAQFRQLGFKDAGDFVGQVLNNFSAIYDAGGRAFDFVDRKTSPNRTVIAETRFDENSGQYEITSAYPRRADQYDKKTPLWERAQTSHSLTGAPRAISGQSGVSDANIPPQGNRVNAGSDTQGLTSDTRRRSMPLNVDDGTISTTARIGDLADKVAKLKQEIAQIKERYQGKLDDEKIRRILEKKGLKGKLEHAENQRKEARKIIKRLNAAAEAGNVGWNAHQEIKGILDQYDLKRRSKETLRQRAELEAYLLEDPEAAGSVNPKDMKYLGRFANLTLDQLRELGERIENIRARGVEERNLKLAVDKERQDNMAAEMLAALPKRKPQYGIVAGRDGLRKQYRGPMGLLRSAGDFVYAATLNLQRLMDYFDSGRGTFKGPWVRNWADKSNAARDEELRHRFRRTGSVEKTLKELGYRWRDFSEASSVPGVPVIDDKGARGMWTRENKMAVYLGMKDPGNARAILHGNFKILSSPKAAKEHVLNMLGNFNHELESDKVQALADDVVNSLFDRSPENLGNAKKKILDALGDKGQMLADMIPETFRYVNDPEGAAQAVIDSMTDKEKAAAEAFSKDFIGNRDRIEQAHIDTTGVGFGDVKHYFPMRRLEFNSSQGIIDPETAEAMAEGKMQGGQLGKAEHGFTIDRQNVPDKAQQPIRLDAAAVWREAVEDQEHWAAYGELLRDLRAALMMRNPVDPDMTLPKQIRLHFGDGAWKALVEHYNVMATGHAPVSDGPVDRYVKAISQNMNVAYLAYSPSVWVQQLTSLARFMHTSGPGWLTKSLAKFIQSPQAFIKDIHEKDPQMRDRVPDYILRELTNDGAWDRFISAGMIPISVFDKFTCAIGWQAAYDYQLSLGASIEEAIREAQRSVILTQSASYIKDVSPILRSGGAAPMLKFMRDRIQHAQLLIYESPQLARRTLEGDKGEGGGRGSEKARRAAWAGLAYLIMGQLLYGMVQRLVRGGPPDRDSGETVTDMVIDGVIGQALESIPIAGNTLENFRQGRYRGQGDFLSAPYVSMLRGFRGLSGALGDEEWDIDRATRGGLSLLEAAALMTGKIPFTAPRRLIHSGKLSYEGEITRALKTMIGMRNEDRFDKVASILSRERREFEERRRRGERIPASDRIRIAHRFAAYRRNIAEINRYIETQRRRADISESTKRARISNAEAGVRRIKESALARFDELLKRGRE